VPYISLPWLWPNTTCRSQQSQVAERALAGSCTEGSSAVDCQASQAENLQTLASSAVLLLLWPYQRPACVRFLATEHGLGVENGDRGWGASWSSTNFFTFHSSITIGCFSDERAAQRKPRGQQFKLLRIYLLELPRVRATPRLHKMTSFARHMPSYLGTRSCKGSMAPEVLNTRMFAVT
jgi:hypothetical protein